MFILSAFYLCVCNCREPSGHAVDSIPVFWTTEPQRWGWSGHWWQEKEAQVHVMPCVTAQQNKVSSCFIEFISGHGYGVPV